MTRYVYECALRWSDLDAYGHVNNSRFLTLYEEARVAMMFTAAQAQGVTSFEEGVVIARHEVDYLRPVDYRAGPGSDPRPQVRIEVWVEEIRPSRFTIGYELFDGVQVASRARSVLVPFDLPNQRPRRLSEVERAYLEPYLASPVTAAGGPVAGADGAGGPARAAGASMIGAGGSVTAAGGAAG